MLLKHTLHDGGAEQTTNIEEKQQIFQIENGIQQ